MMIPSDGPRIDTRTIARTTHGITRNQLVNPFSTVSIRPPKNPAAIPIADPMIMVPRLATSPTVKETRAP